MKRVRSDAQTSRRSVTSPQDEPQIGHAVPANGAAINLKRSEDTDESGIDLVLAPFREQRLRGQLAPWQTAPEGLAHHVRVAAQRLAATLTAAHHRDQILVPEQCELTERVQPALDQSAD